MFASSWSDMLPIAGEISAMDFERGVWGACGIYNNLDVVGHVDG